MNTAQRRPHGVALAAALSLFAVTAAACGGDDNDAAGSTTSNVVNNAESATTAPVTTTGNIIDVAIAAGDFKTLATALTAADLVKTLKGPGPFTVFAPTDAAFAKLPAGTVEGLLKDVPALKNVLLYHVVAGSVTAEQVTKLTSADTVAGKSVSIKVKDGKVFLNDTVQVTMTDIKASNGIIHVIDAVLLPR